MTSIALSELRPFAGLIVKATGGRVLSGFEVRLATPGGLSIPETVLAEAAQTDLAYLKVSAAGANVNLAPALLPDGA